MLRQPSADLYDRIINIINHEEKILILKRRLILQAAGLLFSLGAFVRLSINLFKDLAASGIFQYFSLLFTDFTSVLNNVYDYLLGILESTPTLSLSFALAATLALVFYSAKLADSYADFKKIIKQNI